jgi:hypothetical protein
MKISMRMAKLAKAVQHSPYAIYHKYKKPDFGRVSLISFASPRMQKLLN